MGWFSDITGGIGDAVSGVFGGISDLGSSIDDAVNQIPGGWLTAGLGAAGAGGLFEGLGAGAGASAADAAMVDSLTAAGYWGTGGELAAAGAAGTGAATGGSWLSGAAGQALTGNLLSGSINALLGGGSGKGAQSAAAASDPFASQRPVYQPALAALMSGQFTPTDPSYAWRFQQGQQATDRAQAAMGNLMSGNRLTALTEYGQGMASTEYGNQYNRLAQLAGANVGSPAAAGQILYGQSQAQQSGLGTFASAVGKAAAPAVSNWLSSLF